MLKKVLLTMIGFSLLLVGLFNTNPNLRAIDSSRNDLGILDSLKITNQFGTEIAENSNITNGSWYNLKYSFSLDEPSSDYKNQVAEFNIPNIFKPSSISPNMMDLIFDDGSGNQYVIGVVEADLVSGKLIVKFNDSEILGTKSNIKGWLSLSVKADSTPGNHEVTVSWNGNDETSINVNIRDSGIGTTENAQVNKYISSGKEANNQPTVQQKADGTFYISFSIETMIVRDYDSLVISDLIYSGMKLDASSIKVFSRPKDGQEYYNSSNLTYKPNYDAWKTQYPSGNDSVNFDITSTINNSGDIQTSTDGFKIQINNVKFDPELASRQLDTVPMQMKYLVSYDVILTNIDPSLSLDAAQLSFEKSETKNYVSLIGNDEQIAETNWVKGALSGGATGETRAIIIKKLDKSNNTELDGAIFNLYKKSLFSNDFELYKSNILINGSTIVSDLTFGTYYIKEITAPDGYILDTQPSDSFTIDSATPNDPQQVIITFYNNRDTNIEKTGGYLSILKVNPEKQTLAGAEFDIYDSQGILIETIISDENGVAHSSRLVPGEYTVIEAKAPSGYILSKEVYPFVIESNNTDTLYLEIENKKNENDVLPTTGNQENFSIFFLIIGASILFLSHYLTKKTNCSI